MGKKEHGRERRKGKREKKKRETKEKEGGKEKEKRWEDPIAKRKKRRRVAARRQGVGKEKSQGETSGNPRVLEVRWAWAGLGYSLASQKLLFSFAN